MGFSVQNFSLSLILRVKFAVSALDSRNEELVVGQKVGPLRKIDISCAVKVRCEILMTLIFVSEVFGATRFLTT